MNVPDSKKTGYLILTTSQPTTDGFEKVDGIDISQSILKVPWVGMNDYGIIL